MIVSSQRGMVDGYYEWLCRSRVTTNRVDLVDIVDLSSREILNKQEQ